MANFSPLKYAKALMGMEPSQGGLNYADYPNQYKNPNAHGGGLRAWNENGSWGGQMMPKTSGWHDEIPSIFPGYGSLAVPKLGGLTFSNVNSAKPKQPRYELPVETMTEYSLGGENGQPFYPSIAERMTPEQIQNLRFIESGLMSQNDPRALDVYENAYENQLRRAQQGLSAFKDYN